VRALESVWCVLYGQVRRTHLVKGGRRSRGDDSKETTQEGCLLRGVRRGEKSNVRECKEGYGDGMERGETISIKGTKITTARSPLPGIVTSRTDMMWRYLRIFMLHMKRWESRGERKGGGGRASARATARPRERVA